MSTDLPAWSDEDGLLREAVRALLGRYGRRYFLDCYRDGREPEALWRELCKAGYVGAAVPEHLGGGGSSLDAVVAVGEEMGAAGMPLLSFVMTELCLPVPARFRDH
jgi:alkylation response protein AidB-like acyl-CoA dehydrogenase